MAPPSPNEFESGVWITSIFKYNGRMQNACEPFSGKKITVLGLGLLGRGVGDVEFLASCGALLTVTDKKSAEELRESVEKLKKFPNITFHLGGHNLEDFKNADLVIKAAGVPLDSPEIAAAHKAGVPVAMSTALFAHYAMEEGAKIIGVTGTRGKSTVTHMIYHSHILKNVRTFLGGNIRGKSTLAMLPEIKKDDIVVLELDSWQLQGFGDLKISPNIAVLTNLMPDHQNYYKDMDQYFADKANIFKFQKKGDVLIVGSEVAEQILEANPPIDPKKPMFEPKRWHLKIPGAHNVENAGIAAEALRSLGLTEEEIKSGLESFEGVEGRLQLVRELNGVEIYNDNNATTPEATIVALKSVEKPIILIIGGSEKGLDLKELVQKIKENVAKVILLIHQNYKGSDRLAKELKTAGISFEEADGLEEALSSAIQQTSDGTILFSPAFASFGMFKNEYDRNDQFLKLTKDI
jgi:UDP-N-acetylmuramoylalanine--D-glutamate ligase